MLSSLTGPPLLGPSPSSPRKDVWTGCPHPAPRSRYACSCFLSRFPPQVPSGGYSDRVHRLCYVTHSPSSGDSACWTGSGPSASTATSLESDLEVPRPESLLFSSVSHRAGRRLTLGARSLCLSKHVSLHTGHTLESGKELALCCHPQQVCAARWGPKGPKEFNPQEKSLLRNSPPTSSKTWWLGSDEKAGPGEGRGL